MFPSSVTARIQEHFFSNLSAPVLRVASRDVAVPFTEPAVRKTLKGEGAR
jgi:pyruvate/2-oxoglutarate/acetoin dehydrogenase E1 component